MLLQMMVQTVNWFELKGLHGHLRFMEIPAWSRKILVSVYFESLKQSTSFCKISKIAVILLHTNSGVPNACAILGTSVTREHLSSQKVLLTMPLKK